MDLITMTEERFNGFFAKERQGSFLRASYQYLDRYARTGEVSIKKFAVQIEGQTGVNFGMHIDKDPLATADEPPWYVMVWLPLKNEQLGWDELLPVMYQLTIMPDGRRLDMCIDIPAGNELWMAHDCYTFMDLPESLQRHLQEMSKPLVCMFAWIQKKAFKTQNKIQKVKQRADQEEKKPPKESAGGSRPPRRVIRLSGDATYRVVADRSMPKQFTRHCEAWSVRGHYRHYKSGKVAYIRPYTKGKGRPAGKTYSL